MLTHQTAQRHNEAIQLAQQPALLVRVVTRVLIEDTLTSLLYLVYFALLRVSMSIVPSLTSET